MKEKSVWGFIPARGGSKGIPRKNLFPLKGKPLIAYTIEASLKSKYINRTIVSTDDEEIAQISKEFGAEVPFLRPKHLAKDDTPMREVMLWFIEEIKKRKGIIDASPDYIFKVLWRPNDTYYEYQWNLWKFLNLEKAWDVIGGGSEDVIIGILDTGCSFEFYSVPSYERDKVLGTTYRIYPDYNSSTFLQGKDFVNNDNHPNDDNGHGTHISGTIAEATNNGLGVAGIAFNVKIVPIKVLDYNGLGYLSTIADGIVWATDSANVDIINISLGASESNPYLSQAILYAYQKNVIFVGATGNDGEEGIYYPARYNEVLGVGAIDIYGRRADYSNYGYGIDIVAPGGAGTNNDDFIFQETFKPFIDNDNLAVLDSFGYYGFVGTSMATAHISALCALMLSINPDLKNYEIYNIIVENCNDISPSGWDKYTGYGIPDFERCVKEAFMFKKFDKLSDIIEVDSMISRGTVNIRLKEDYIFPIDIYVFDIIGRNIQTIHITHNARINIESSGIYFLYGEKRSGIKLTIIK